MNPEISWTDLFSDIELSGEMVVVWPGGTRLYSNIVTANINDYIYYTVNSFFVVHGDQIESISYFPKKYYQQIIDDLLVGRALITNANEFAIRSL